MGFMDWVYGWGLTVYGLGLGTVGFIFFGVEARSLQYSPSRDPERVTVW